MVSTVSLNYSQALRTDLQSAKNTPKNIGFAKNKDENSEVEEESTQKPLKQKKLDFKRALKQFGDGFISPLKAMVDSPTSVAVTAGVGALTIFILKKAPPVGRLLVTAGVAMGSIQTALGIKKAVQEKTVEEKEKGIYEAGQGAFSLTAAALTSKPFLIDAAKAEGVAMTEQEIENMGMLKSTWECIKGTPKSFKSLVENLTNDEFISESIATLAGKPSKIITETVENVSDAKENGKGILKNALEKRLLPIAEGDEAFKDATK